MKFDKDQHQKVRYQGQLYVVLLEEFPQYRQSSTESAVVLHPIANDWIVRINNPRMRDYMTIRKAELKEVPHHVVE